MQKIKGVFLRHKGWTLLATAIVFAAVIVAGVLWWRANIPAVVYDNTYMLNVLETDDPALTQGVDFSSTLYRTWGDAKLENPRTYFSDYEALSSLVYNEEARVAIYVTPDCPYTAAYYKRAFRNLQHAQVRLIYVPYSRAEVFEAWPQIEEAVFGDRFSVYAKVVIDFDSVRGWQVFVGLHGPEADAAQAYLEEHFAGRVAVLPEDQIMLDLDLLPTNGKTGYSKKYLAGK